MSVDQKDGTCSCESTQEPVSYTHLNSGAHANFISPSLPENERNTASAPIVVDGEQVGTVFVRVFGSQTLLTQADQDFRNKSYQAMIFASLFSVLVAILAGFILARLLSRPINSDVYKRQALRTSMKRPAR